MPRPNKTIQYGSLTDPVAASRSASWRKHAGPEHASQFEPDGTILVDPLTHETVAEIDLTEVNRPVVSVVPNIVDDVPVPVPLSWETERLIKGRLYHRLDELVAEHA